MMDQDSALDKYTDVDECIDGKAHYAVLKHGFRAAEIEPVLGYTPRELDEYYHTMYDRMVEVLYYSYTRDPADDVHRYLIHGRLDNGEYVVFEASTDADCLTCRMWEPGPVPEPYPVSWSKTGEGDLLKLVMLGGDGTVVDKAKAAPPPPLSPRKETVECRVVIRVAGSREHTAMYIPDGATTSAKYTDRPVIVRVGGIPFTTGNTYFKKSYKRTTNFAIGPTTATTFIE